jgi:hypothetical protein
VAGPACHPGPGSSGVDLAPTLDEPQGEGRAADRQGGQGGAGQPDVGGVASLLAEELTGDPERDAQVHAQRVTAYRTGTVTATAVAQRPQRAALAGVVQPLVTSLRPQWPQALRVLRW